MRPIDADALIAEFEDYIKSNRACGNNICVTVAEVLTETIIDAPTIEQPTWISVEDRLPDDEEEVLLYDRVFRFYELGKYHKRSKVLDPHWTIYGNTYPISSYTHWMPLPEPPKGVK